MASLTSTSSSSTATGESNSSSRYRSRDTRRDIVPTRQEGNVRIVPDVFEKCMIEDLIVLIASMLDRLVQHNDQIPLTPNSLTRFHSRSPPGISIPDYLLRIVSFTNVESACLLILLHYIDKVCERIPSFTISSLTVHRFLIAGVCVGSKALSDSFCTNTRYAKVGGVSLMEMNVLEREFCEVIDWRLVTTSLTLSTYYTSLVRSHPSYLLNQDANPPSPRPSTTSSLEMDVDETDAEDISSFTDSIAASSSADVIIPLDFQIKESGNRELEEPPPSPILRPVNL